MCSPYLRGFARILHSKPKGCEFSTSPFLRPPLRGISGKLDLQILHLCFLWSLSLWENTFLPPLSPMRTSFFVEQLFLYGGTRTHAVGNILPGFICVFSERHIGGLAHLNTTCLRFSSWVLLLDTIQWSLYVVNGNLCRHLWPLFCFEGVLFPVI